MRENNDIPRKRHFEQSRHSIHPQHSGQLEENEDHDVKRNGKNRQELGGNDCGSYKHRSPQGPPETPRPQVQQFDHNPILFQNQPTEQGTNNLSPSNLNRHELYSRYRFKRGSKLKSYLADKNIAGRNNHLLIEILVVIKDTIIQQMLYDPTNRAMIICNDRLPDTLCG